MKPTNAGTSPWIRALFAGAAVIGGCAAMSDTQCRSADWYEIGYRDGIFGLQPQDGVYTHQCSGASVDLARYGQGWREGKWEFDSRMRKD